MDRGAWWATVHGLQRVRYQWSDWACKSTRGMIQLMKKKSNKDVFINIGLCHNCMEIKCFKEYLHKWAMINSGERNGLKETELKRGLSFLYYTHLYFVYNKNICTYYISTCKIFLNQPLKSIHWMRNPGVHRCISIKKPLHTLALKMMVFKNKWVKVKK